MQTGPKKKKKNVLSWYGDSGRETKFSEIRMTNQFYNHTVPHTVNWQLLTVQVCV
jgi:hypothetical protein